MKRLGRATAYLLGVLCTAVGTAVALPLLLSPAWGRPWVDWHRRRAGRVLGVATEPHAVAVRRYARWLLVHVSMGVPVGVAALFGVGNLLLAVAVIPLWWVFPAHDPVRLFVEVPVTSWGTAIALGLLQIAVLGGLAYVVFPFLAAVHARITLAMLAPSAAEQIANLTRTRVDVLEAHGAELRRIERDLHDGTQARLVGIALRLALAREAATDNPQLLDRLLREAHEGTEEAMTELRDVIRTVYPPILADRGLAGALKTVATRGGVPTQLDVGELGRVPAAVEAVAYFAVTEALTNVAKHSRATGAAVRVRRSGDRLSITVSDNGVGGADASAGTGLDGIRRRVRALDGTMTLTSPTCGPTEVTVEVPCGW